MGVVLQSVTLRNKIGETAWRLWVLLTDYRNARGWCWLTRADMARRPGYAKLSDRQVRRALTRLYRAGLVSAPYRRGKLDWGRRVYGSRVGTESVRVPSYAWRQISSLAGRGGARPGSGRRSTQNHKNQSGPPKQESRVISPMSKSNRSPRKNQSGPPKGESITNTSTSQNSLGDRFDSYARIKPVPQEESNRSPTGGRSGAPLKGGPERGGDPNSIPKGSSSSPSGKNRRRAGGGAAEISSLGDREPTGQQEPTPTPAPLDLQALLAHPDVPKRPRVPQPAIPEPPLLDPNQSEADHIEILARLYRTAAEKYYPGRRDWTFKRGAANSKYADTLQRAARVMLAHKVPPGGWVAWVFDGWIEHSKQGKQRPPFVNVVYGPDKIAKRRGWFRREWGDGRGGGRRQKLGQHHQGLLRRWESMRLDLIGAVADAQDTAAIQRVVAKHFPGNLYAELLQAAQIESAEEQGRLDYEARRGTFLW